jgi:hypothetical protein
MKKSELQKIIKEEIRKVLNEAEVDMNGKVCKKCKKGKYKETSHMDDLEGVLHCDKCGEETERYIIKEEIEAVLVNNKANNYMFFQNLKTIKSAVDAMLQMDPMMVDQILSNGHDWANDHITTSKDDVEEVYNFLKNYNSQLDEKIYSSEQEKIAAIAPPEDKITGADFAALRKK